jgi:hypothetical protein
MEAWKLKMESGRVCVPVVTDMHHVDEKQDPDPHQSKKPGPNQRLSEKEDQDLHQRDADPQH